MQEKTQNIDELPGTDALNDEQPKWSNLPTIAFRKLQKKTLGEILVERKTITEAQLKEALSLQAGPERQRLGEILVERSYVTEEQMLKALAYQLDLPYYERLPVNDIDPTLVEHIPIQFCRDHKILPIARDDFNVTVAVADPLNIFPLDDLRLILATNINIIVSAPAIIEHSINRVFERSNDASQKVLDDLNVPEIGAEEDLEQTKDLLESSDDEKPIIRLVNGLLARAVKEKASDIHIEPYEHEIVVRFRVDGSLQDKMQIPKRHSGSLASRVKILAKLNIAEKRVPQDGRIQIKVAGKDIDVRISVLPTAHGERIVMRLLDKSSGAKSLDAMGLNQDVYRKYAKMIESNHGIVLVTGPTGSGKSTLLYASLLAINTTDVNILTIEDPVEYQVPGIGQIEVKEKVGLTFAAGLRSILRQDPDVIMIGEIRDSETADIAVQSSLTGHLVLSTLHTNDTASTITRLVDMGIQPFQISSALLGVISVRLLRKLCTFCREEQNPSDKELELIKVPRQGIEGKKVYQQGPGCERCLGEGYSGRTGVYELMVISDKVRNQISNNPDGKLIKRISLETGMQTLRESAVELVLRGETSISEALQKTQADDDIT